MLTRTSHGCAVFNLGGREVVVVAGGQVSPLIFYQHPPMFMLTTKSKSDAFEAGGEVLSSVEYLGLVGNENWASLPPLPLPRSSY